MMDGMNIEISGTSLLGDLGEPGRRRSSRILSQVLTPERSLSNTPSSKMKNPASVIDTPYSAANGHPASPYGGTDVSIPPRSLRNRTVDAKKEQVRQAVDEAMRPMSDKDRRHYKGWLELESDPALFNHVLRQYGVQDIRVQDLATLDDEALALLPQPVYGLIFLFRYQDDDTEEPEDAQKCPKHVWFANQTTDNACATVALMNIVMNAPDLCLGEELQEFKNATSNLKPRYRGRHLSNDDFIRPIHNSFVRKIDVLNADLALSNEYKESKKKKAPRKKATPKKGSKPKPKADDDAGFHFVAYVPVRGEVWRLDGLQRNPLNLGDAGDDWVGVARNHILHRLLDYQDAGVECSLMSLSKSRLPSITEELAKNMYLILAIEKVLGDMTPDWEAFLDFRPSSSLDELKDACGLTLDLMEKSVPYESEQRNFEEVKTDFKELVSLYRKLVDDQKRIRVVHGQESEDIRKEDRQAAKRKVDHSGLIYNAINVLAQAGVLKDIVKDIEGEKDGRQFNRGSS